MHTYIHMYVCMYVRTYVCTYVHACSKLNELSGKDITACGISFLCNFDGKAKESDEGKCLP